jgi:hypothetical protein
MRYCERARATIRDFVEFENHDGANPRNDFVIKSFCQFHCSSCPSLQYGISDRSLDASRTIAIPANHQGSYVVEPQHPSKVIKARQGSCKMFRQATITTPPP